MTKITVVEVAPRDGWQSVREQIPTETKLALIRRMFAAGIVRMQIGSFVSPKAIPQMADIAQVVEAVLAEYPDKRPFVLVPNFKGAQRAAAAGLKEFTTVISVSEQHNLANVNCTVSDSLQQFARMRQEFPDLRISADLATSFGCPFAGETPLARLLEIVGAVVARGADSVTLCDTIGVAHPLQVAAYVQAVRHDFPQLPLAIHIHDTRNMGMLNTYTAIQNGVYEVETALGGLGGCPFAPGASGNTATEDLVYLLQRSGYQTDIDFPALLAAAKEMHALVPGNYSGHQININACAQEANC